MYTTRSRQFMCFLSLYVKDMPHFQQIRCWGQHTYEKGYLSLNWKTLLYFRVFSRWKWFQLMRALTLRSMHIYSKEASFNHWASRAPAALTSRAMNSFSAKYFLISVTVLCSFLTTGNNNQITYRLYKAEMKNKTLPFLGLFFFLFFCFVLYWFVF